MTFKEFREAQLSTYGGLYRVTYNGDDGERTEFLRWEPSNYKWYRPKPYYGWEEFGYLDSVDGCSNLLAIAPQRYVFVDPQEAA